VTEVREPRTRNRGYLGAFRKGVVAAQAGRPRRQPYPDLRGGEHGQVVTWSRAFARYWLDGYDAARAASAGVAAEDGDRPDGEGGR